MATIATVTIMLILMTTIIIAANNISNNTKRINFASEIKSIQQAVDSYVEKNEGEYPTVNSVITDISQLDPIYQSQFTANGESLIDGKIILNEIDYSKIGVTDLKYGTGKRGNNDIYAVSNQTGKVYYVMGINIDNYSYYTLTQDLLNLLKLNDNQMDDTDPVIIFTPNKIDWTSQEVKVSVKIPKIFSLVQIKVNNKIIAITDPIEEGSYNVYNISNPGNYSIVVTYRKNQNDVDNFYAKYSVTNFDNIAPAFTLGEINKMVGENLLSYVEITSKVENGSGLKKIKYEYNSIYETITSEENKAIIKAHFENNGVDLDTKATIIPITKGSRKLTVYMEDNAGNFSIQTIVLEGNSEIKDDYVKNGLILYLDGINNSGEGHSATTSVWKNLNGKGNNGSIVGASWINNGLSFDGIDDYVPIAELNYPEFTVEITFEASKLIGSSNEQKLICSHNQGGFDICIMDDYITSSTYINGEYRTLQDKRQIITTNKKYNVTMTTNGSEIKLYVNGVLVSNISVENGVIGYPSNNSVVMLGANPNGNSPEVSVFFNGTIYSVRMYNRVLMEKEIKNNYDMDKSRFGV